jgi:hypothetical protein
VSCPCHFFTPFLDHVIFFAGTDFRAKVLLLALPNEMLLAASSFRLILRSLIVVDEQ